MTRTVRGAHARVEADVEVAGRADALVLAFGAAVPLVAILSDQFGSSVRMTPYPLPLILLSVGMIAFSSIAFLRDGRSLITPQGIYQMASAIFAGATPLFMSAANFPPSPELMTTLLTIHIVNVAVYGLVRLYATGWKAQTEHARMHPWAAIECQADVRRVIGAGVFLIAIASFLLIRNVTVGGMPARIAHAGVALIGACALVALPRSGPRRWLLAPLPIVSVAIYVTFFFAGFGRLIVATLILSIVVAVNMARPRAWHKLVIVVGVGPALIVGGLVGVDRSPVTSGDGNAAGVLLEGQGLASVFEPANTFATLVDLDKGGFSTAFPRQYGRTFGETLFTWVPRAWWPNKPPGFGSRLTQVLAPRLTVTGHSMAALAWGEWFVNFGWAGVAMSAPILAVLLIALARWQQGLLLSERWSSDAIVGVTMFAVASAGVADYVWVGSFTYFARSGVVLVVLYGVRLFLRNGSRKRPMRITEELDARTRP